MCLLTVVFASVKFMRFPCVWTVPLKSGRDRLLTKRAATVSLRDAVLFVLFTDFVSGAPISALVAELRHPLRDAQRGSA